MLVTRLILVEGTKTLSFLQKTHQPRNDVKKTCKSPLFFKGHHWQVFRFIRCTHLEIHGVVGNQSHIFLQKLFELKLESGYTWI